MHPINTEPMDIISEVIELSVTGVSLSIQFPKEGKSIYHHVLINKTLLVFTKNILSVSQILRASCIVFIYTW